jgi:hypothetical protein
MNNIIKTKSLIAIMLSIVVLCAAIPLSSTSTNSHQEIINQFIYEITEVQTQVFDIAQFALNQSLVPGDLSPNIRLIDDTIKRLDRKILNYLETIPSVSTQNRDVLLLLNALNFIKNGLYTLNLLTIANTDVERIALLDEFFRSRIAAKDTINTLESFNLKR